MGSPRFDCTIHANTRKLTKLVVRVVLTELYVLVPLSASSSTSRSCQLWQLLEVPKLQGGRGGGVESPTLSHAVPFVSIPSMVDIIVCIYIYYPGYYYICHKKSHLTPST